MLDPHLRDVVGWLASTLQLHRGMLAGVPLEYTTNAGILFVSWRGGPTADMVAAELVQAADPDLPVTLRPARASAEFLHLSVGDLTVCLHPHDPMPDQPWAPRVGQHPNSRPWPWPWRLHDSGAAYDTVLWTAGNVDSGGDEVAVVVRVSPSAATPAHSSWSESGFRVIDADHVVPDHASAETKRLWRQRTTNAHIRLRYATTDWSDAEADEWLAGDGPHQQRPMISAVLLDERCIIRVDAGLRIVATVADGSPWVSAPWDVLPSALYSALSTRVADHLNPPEFLNVRRYGDAWSQVRFQLSSQLVAPGEHSYGPPRSFE
ncbi:hypothetical protein AB0L13_35040 [Saccharopolyspora shandongensis]|uniref:hypothetical protein n=1 Tax=Saccharopolyspora shandongensis TaxID=418495 RepID=UPI0034208813